MLDLGCGEWCNHTETWHLSYCNWAVSVLMLHVILRQENCACLKCSNSRITDIVAQGFIYGAYLALMYECALVHLPQGMLEAIEWKKKAKKLLFLFSAEKQNKKNRRAPAYCMTVMSAWWWWWLTALIYEDRSVHKEKVAKKIKWKATNEY